jgi:hypothetical protein
MNKEELKKIQENSQQRDSLKEFMIEILEKITVDRVFKNESVAGIPEAKILIDKVFSELDKINDK